MVGWSDEYVDTQVRDTEVLSLGGWIMDGWMNGPTDGSVRAGTRHLLFWDLAQAFL